AAVTPDALLVLPPQLFSSAAAGARPLQAWTRGPETLCVRFTFSSEKVNPRSKPANLVSDF
uniref:Uncharacterized protein n=1 Tax=Scophthalmus maximus TaxID=52904 RepID=A0A8D3B7X8_SCOMX